MVCSSCKKQTEWCECQKNNEIVKRWPRGTWFQERIKKVTIAKTNGHEPPRDDRGFALVNVCMALLIACAIVVSLVTLAYVGRQAFENLQSVGRCVQALLECTHI